MKKQIKHVYRTAKKSKKVRFGLVGVVNTITDFGILNILAGLFGMPLVVSSFISTTAAMLVSFGLNKKAVFRQSGNTKSQIVLFFAVTLTSIWVIQSIVIMIVHPLFAGLPDEVSRNIAKLIAVCVGLVWNYFFYNQLVFANKPLAKLDTALEYIEHHFKFVVAIGSTMSLVVALIMAYGHSVWFDEGYSIMVAQRPFNELLELTKVDAHPPFYYLYLKSWGTVFGWSEISLRLSSAIPGALSVGFMMLIIRRLFTARAAIVAMPFIVIAPFLARYNYEIRMYALVAFIGVLATWLLLKARGSKSTAWWLAYAAIVAIGMYTLYMSVVIWLAHAIWLVYDDLKHRRNIIFQKQWLFYALSVAVFLPWLPTVLYQLDHSALPPYMTNLTLESFANTLIMAITYTPIWYAPPLLVGLLVIAIALFGWLIIHIRRVANKNEWSGIALLTLGFVIAIVFYWYISQPPQPPRFVERYAVHILPFFYALIGVVTYLGFRIGKRIQALCFGVLAIGLMSFGLFTLHETGNYNFQRLQHVSAKTVRSDIGCDKTTFVTSGAYGYIDMWYDFGGCDFRYFQPADLTYVGGYAPINKLNTTARVKSIQDLNTNRIAFIYYNDSTEFMEPDSRYKLDYELHFDGTHVKIYQRI